MFGRRDIRRVGVPLLLALLPAFAPDAFGLPCPHHAGHLPSDPGNAGAHDPSDAGHGGARHAAPAHTDDAGATHGHAPVDETPPPCTCAGECPTSGTAEAPRMAFAKRLAERPIRVRANPHPRTQAPPIEPSWLQPPATAPPVV